jgi:hypothetical protein
MLLGRLFSYFILQIHWLLYLSRQQTRQQQVARSAEILDVNHKWILGG